MSSAERADRTETTVVIADDPAVVRQGLRMLVDAEADLQPAAEAGNLNLQGESGVDAIPRLRETCPDTAIVVLTMQEDPGFARQALQAGALAFVLKEAADEELLQAIHLAAGGENYLNPRRTQPPAADPRSPASNSSAGRTARPARRPGWPSRAPRRWG